MRFEKSERLT